MAGFDNPWYAEIIERFSSDPDDDFDANGTSSAIHCLGRSLLAASCIVSQAIDGLTHAVGKVADAVKDVAVSMPPS